MYITKTDGICPKRSSVIRQPSKEVCKTHCYLPATSCPITPPIPIIACITWSVGITWPGNRTGQLVYCTPINFVRSVIFEFRTRMRINPHVNKCGNSKTAFESIMTLKDANFSLSFKLPQTMPNVRISTRRSPLTQDYTGTSSRMA